MTKICNKWKRVNLGNNMYSQSLPINECPFCGLRLIETYNFENTYIYCPKCGNQVIDKENEGGRMTRERIEGMREVVLPFVKKRLLETNYENLGESDAEEFAREFNEILDLAIKALEQEPRKGRWIKTPKAVMGEGYMWYCDKCKHQVYQDSSRDYPSEKFCPSCGSDNREVQE